MMLEEKKPLLAWHTANQKRIFDLQKELCLAGMESTFPIAAFVVLCFVFVAVDNTPIFWLLLGSADIASRLSLQSPSQYQRPIGRFTRDSPDQVRQEGLRQQAGQTYKEGFKLDLAGEGDEVLSTRQEPGAAEVLGTIREEELKTTVQLESYDLIAIAETWWDELHN